MAQQLNRIALLVFSATFTCVASAAALAWGLVIHHPGEGDVFIDKTRPTDFIGQWLYHAEADKDDVNAEDHKDDVKIDVHPCGGNLCFSRAVGVSLDCSHSMLVVTEDHKAPLRIRDVEDGPAWRFSGKLFWINGKTYDMEAEIVGKDGWRVEDGKLPKKADQILFLSGGPFAEGRDNWGGRTYPDHPDQFKFSFVGPSACAATS